jgi:hypothetical protein
VSPRDRGARDTLAVPADQNVELDKANASNHEQIHGLLLLPRRRASSRNDERGLGRNLKPDAQARLLLYERVDIGRDVFRLRRVSITFIRGVRIEQ